MRDLVDLVILCEHELLERPALTDAIRHVWVERDAAPPPFELPPLPETWPPRYERMAAEHDLVTKDFAAAVTVVAALLDS